MEWVRGVSHNELETARSDQNELPFRNLIILSWSSHLINGEVVFDFSRIIQYFTLVA